MKLKTFNIDINFSFSEIHLYLHKFWVDEMKTMKNKNIKIWITISVVNTDNTSFILIKNLPFYDYEDVLIVLKQSFDDKALYNRKDKLTNIYFSYYLGKEPLKDSYYLYYLICIKYLFILLFIILTYYVDYSVSDDVLNILNIPAVIEFNQNDLCFNKITDPIIKQHNKNIAYRFIELFNPNSSINYFPSYFIKDNIKLCEEKDFSMLEYINSQQFLILENVNVQKLNFIKDYEKIHTEFFRNVSEFSETINWIISHKPF